MDDFSFLERRKFVRVSAEVPLKFKVFSRTNQPLTEIVETQTKNLSLGGLMIEVSGAPEPVKNALSDKQNRLDLELHLSAPDEDVKLEGKVVAVNLEGKIRWGSKAQGSYLLGVEFVNVTPDTAQILKKHLIQEYLSRYNSL